VLVTGLSAAPHVEIHVSPTGDDAADGSAQHPLRTLSAAQLRARAQAGESRVTIWLADGTYYLEEPFVLTPEDKGTQDMPVTYKASNEGKAVLSGGIRLDLDWKPHGDGIFKARTPDGLDLDQLFVNGTRQHMARYPNYDPTKTTVPYRGCAADAISPERVATWADPDGGYIHAMHKAHWGGYHYRITGKDDQGGLVYEGGWQNNRPSPMHEKSRMVENIFEELDAPGEWFHDRKTQQLYFYPPAGIDLQSAKVEGVRLATLIELRGTQQNPVRHVVIDGLVLRHTIRTFMDNKEPLLRSDWTIYRSGAVLIEGAEDCALTNCFIDQAGANGIFVNGYNRRVRLAGLHVFGVGASGVAFVGKPEAVRNPVFQYGNPHSVRSVDKPPGPKTDDYPMECVVENSLIHEVGMVEKQGAGVQIAMARRITVRDCSIYDTSRAGINIGDGTWGGHLIERCDVFNTVQETGDHGSFNSWGRDRYWLPGNAPKEVVEEVAKNPQLPFLDAMETTVIRDSRWRCDHGWDIDLDDGSSNYRIENNLMLHGGLKLREGYRRFATNNITVNNTLHPHVWYPNSGDVFKGNIVMRAYRPALMHHDWGKEIDYNLFTTNHQDRTKFADKGCDLNSVVGDPNFADPATGDFTVQNQALADRIGFKNFAMDQFGVKKPALKAIAKTPEMSEVKIQADLPPLAHKIKPLKARKWLGARLSEPKGDALSAYGADLSGGGVAVDQIAPKSPLSGKGRLQPGDLIQALNGNKVQTIDDLIKASTQAKNGRLKFTVLRSQSEVFVEFERADK